MIRSAVLFPAIFLGAAIVQCAPTASAIAHGSPGSRTSHRGSPPAHTMLVAQNDTPVRSGDMWDLEPAGGKPNGYYAQGEGFHVRSSNARIMLRQKLSAARVHSLSPVELDNGGTHGAVSFSGSATIERGDAAGRVFIAATGLGRIGVAVPCTLLAKSEFGIVTVEGVSYRGSVIVAPDQGGLFSLVNFVDVEDYLRGVVPLEVGKGGVDVAEAVKAQAVAARTYTFRKMQDNALAAFDLNATVSDQVYGGVGAEAEACSRAILDTRDQIMVYHDSLIYAYYHSTCGGRTANIEDVWNKSALGYLRSADDENGWNGPYCSQSGSFTWEERWPLTALTGIVTRFSRETFPQNPCTGDVRDVTVNSRFSCGRVRQCSVHTSSGTFSYGGDKVRFVFRRNLPGFPILKSSIITGITVRDGILIMKGRGYGHGVGMCQTGALGRARNGEKYDEILHAYYAGIEIRKVTK